MEDSGQRVVPARPHHKLTDDGRRMREVLSYSRRGSRFTPRQAEAWAAHQERFVIPDAAVDREGFSIAERFGIAKSTASYVRSGRSWADLPMS